MLCYFVSKENCILKINGLFCGVVTANTSRMQIEPSSLIELTPTDPMFCPVCFIFSSNEKPDNVRIIDLYRGFLIIPIFKKSCSFPFCTLYSKQFSSPENYKITIYSDCSIKLSIDGDSHFFLGSADNYAPGCETQSSIIASHLIIKFLSKRNYAMVFGLPQLNKVYDGMFDDIYADNSNNLIIEWQTNTLTRITKRHSFPPNAAKEEVYTFRKREINSLPNELLPYAFLEEYINNCNYTDFLAPNIKEHSAMLGDFLGKAHFFLPPIPELPNAIILIGDKTKFLAIEIKNRLIENISIL